MPKTCASKAVASTVALPPGGQLEIVFSFDTTGSMYGHLDQVRGRLQDMIQRLQADIHCIRIAVFAHGDYCDTSTYVTKWIDFSSDAAKLCTFVNDVKKTGGGDAPECYELVLRQARTELSWTPGSRRALVMIGDDLPHDASYALNKDNIDWRTETTDLLNMGVTIYGVQCGRSTYATPFYKTIATVTDGKHLRLEDMGGIFDVLMAVCYRENNDANVFANYEQEARARGQALCPDVDAIFKSLRDDEALSKAPSTTTTSTPWPLKKPTSITTPKKGKSPSFKLAPPSKKRAPLWLPKSLKNKTVKRSLYEEFKLENLPLHNREDVTETYFSLRTLKWTPWTTAWSPTLPLKAGPFAKRRGKCGFRLKALHTKCPSSKPTKTVRLFEVAVVVPSKRRIVMFSKMSSRCINTSSWERFFLSRAARARVDKVLSQGCSIMIRHCVIQKGKRVASMANVQRDLKRYDYAWCKAGSGIRKVTWRPYGKSTHVDEKVLSFV